jgi:hypothetical protein
MTWTYVLEDLGTSSLYQARLEINDTNEDDQLLQDEEIEQLASVEANFWGTCARCCEVISRGYLRLADIRLGRALYEINAKRSEQYAAMAKALRAKALGADVPWVGGMSRSDKITYAQDPDLVQPAFTRSMMVDPFVGELGSDSDDGLPFDDQ